MKIYTKKGDKGETSLLTGTKVSKSHIRLDAYGTVDELNAYIGLLRDQLKNDELREHLLKIQSDLFVIGSQLASDKNIKEIPDITEDDILFLEKSIDNYEENLPKLTTFVLPGGHSNVSFCHIARTVCRRAERLTNKLVKSESVNELIIKYLNRLSDYLFVFARLLAKELKIVEIKWEHRLNK